MNSDKYIGIYRLLHESGSGSFGVVYLAENSITAQKVALKVLHARQAQRELAGLIHYRECRHANLLQIHHIDRLPDGRIYYTMDAADNRSNDETYEPDTLAARGRIPPGELTTILHALLNAVEALHRKNLLHRDIKPENILFVDSVPVLGDIGLTANLDTASLAGTPQYLPPEVVSGGRPPDQASDLFALGQVAYTVLTGNLPGQYPNLPSDLAPDSAAVLEFCRVARQPGSSIAACREALELKARPDIFCRKKNLLATFMILLVILSGSGYWISKITKVSPAAPIPPAVPGTSAVPGKAQSVSSAVATSPEKTASATAKHEEMFQVIPADEVKKELAALHKQYPEVPKDLAKRAQDRNVKLFFEYCDIKSQSQQGKLSYDQRMDAEEKHKKLLESDRLIRLASVIQRISHQVDLLCSQRYRMNLDRLKTLYIQRQQLIDDLQKNPPPPDSDAPLLLLK